MWYTERTVHWFVRNEVLQGGAAGLKDDRLYLNHILERIERIHSIAVSGEEAFLTSQMSQDAVAYNNFEIIGEATKRLSQDTRDRAVDIPWRDWARFRDRLIHRYDGVYWHEVWKIIREDIPRLEPQIRALLEAMNEEAGNDRRL